MNATAKVKLFLRGKDNPSKEYEVLSYDPETQTAKLKGKYAPFEMKPFTKEAVEKKGFTLVKKE